MNPAQVLEDSQHFLLATWRRTDHSFNPPPPKFFKALAGKEHFLGNGAGSFLCDYSAPKCLIEDRQHVVIGKSVGIRFWPQHLHPPVACDFGASFFELRYTVQET